MRDYGPRDQDVFRPDMIVQLIFCIEVDRHTRQCLVEAGRKVPRELNERLKYHESYVKEQIRRWGIERINSGIDMIEEGRPTWDRISDLFPPRTQK